MRFIPILLIAFFAALPVQAQTPITKESANAFYEQCKVQPSSLPITEETRELVCACTAAHMMDGVYVEDVRAMGGEGPEARTAFNKVTLNVYAPCVHFAEKESRYNNCMSDPETLKLTSNPSALCNCMSTEVASYLQAHSRTAFEEILDRRGEYIQDPMTALSSDPEFEKFAHAKLLGCVAQNR